MQRTLYDIIAKGENLMNITHIIDSERWGKAKEVGYYEPESLRQEGFIHCSSINQVIKVANNIYKGKQGLKILLIDESKVKPDIIWEDLYNLNELYPHIYGVLNLDSIIIEHEFNPREDGTFELPIQLVKQKNIKS
jgi:uncharacterized protein (DUF952 family)